MILIIIIALCFVAYVRYLESVTVFHPSKKIEATPAQAGLKFEDIYFRTKDKNLLNGWFVKNPRARSMVLYLHGNAGNICDRLDKIAAFHDMGVNVFIIDYRGYGKSQGKPSEHGIYEDAAAAYDYLLTREDVHPDTICVYGASLGGVAAVDLAAKRKIAGLIIDSSFSSAADMAKTIHPLIPAFLLRTKMDSIHKIHKITVAKLFIHSQEDQVVPYRLGKKLFDAALPPKDFLEVKGGHNDSHIYSKDIWASGIRNFLKKSNLLNR